MPSTIPELLRAAASRAPDKVWLRGDSGTNTPGSSAAAGDPLTFAQALARVAGTAERLADAGVRRADLVLLTMRTTPAHLLVWLAVTSMGAIAVTTDPEMAIPELEGMLAQVRPRLVVTDGELLPRLQAAGSARYCEQGVRLVENLADAGEYPVSGGPDLAGQPVPGDVATLIPTSGTTGRSKLVMQTHRAYAMAGEGFPHWMELSEQDCLMTSLPLFHINATAYSTMGSLACGAGLVLLQRFSASAFLDCARRYAATEFNAIGAMLEILMRQPPRSDDADTALRLVYTGPAPTRERHEEMEARFGLRIVCGYAMSESPYGLIWPRGQRPFGTLGALRQHPSLGVVNSCRVVGDDGRDVEPGEVGELLLHNPAVTPGYWQMPQETAAAVVDGWLHTGDLVTEAADGCFTFVARTKEVLRRRGENLSPAEVEDAILAHPDVVECAVVGVASDLSEEEVKAFVVAAPGRTPDFGALHEFAGARLSAFKVPRFWQAVDALPRTPTSRVAKHRLPTGHPPGEWDAVTEVIAQATDEQDPQ